MKNKEGNLSSITNIISHTKLCNVKTSFSNSTTQAYKVFKNTKFEFYHGFGSLSFINIKHSNNKDRKHFYNIFNEHVLRLILILITFFLLINTSK